MAGVAAWFWLGREPATAYRTVAATLGDIRVGARTRDIFSQFLVEAVTLSVVGGILGIALGITASELISHFADWSTQISLSSVALAFLFPALVGVFFGYYPARKAAFPDPIDALRYE